MSYGFVQGLWLRISPSGFPSERLWFHVSKSEPRAETLRRPIEIEIDVYKNLDHWLHSCDPIVKLYFSDQELISQCTINTKFLYIPSYSTNPIYPRTSWSIHCSSFKVINLKPSNRSHNTKFVRTICRHQSLAWKQCNFRHTTTQNHFMTPQWKPHRNTLMSTPPLIL